MWQVVPASVIGTAHQRLGTPCQDSCGFLRLNALGSELLILAVSDGAGSAENSHIGSAEAVQHLMSTVRTTAGWLKEVNELQVRHWMEAVRAHLENLAQAKAISVGSLACTLLLSIVGSESAIFAQIGDGAWVVEKDGKLSVGTWPDNGEFANLTTFITSDRALDSIQFVHLKGKISAVAGFTDGIQALALNYAAREPHVPFFEPMIAAVRASDDDTSLIAPLHAFLASDAVTTRTDDDKTLVIACWREKRDDANGDCR